jgi:hypothetical protein
MPFLAPPRYLDSVKMHSDIAESDSKRSLLDYKLQQAQQPKAPNVSDEIKIQNVIAQASREAIAAGNRAGPEGSPEFMSAFERAVKIMQPDIARITGRPEIATAPPSYEHAKMFASWDPGKGDLKNHFQALGVGGGIQTFDQQSGTYTPAFDANGKPIVKATDDPNLQGAIAGARARNNIYSQEVNGRTGHYTGAELTGQQPQTNAAPTTGYDNNPGNIRPPGASTGFQAYDTPEAGLKAIDNLLLEYGQKGDNTLTKIISRYAPRNENQTDALIATAAKRLSIDPNQPLDMNNPNVRHVISGAILLQENPVLRSQGATQQTTPTTGRLQSQSTQEKKQIESDINIKEAAQKSDIAVNEATRKEEEKTKLKSREDLPSVTKETNYLINKLEQARDHKGMSGVVGWPSAYGALPLKISRGTPEANFKVLMDQIKGSTFLDAYKGLKGGGQITEIEGEKATQAKARLDTSQTEDEFKAALNEYIQVLQDNLDSARVRAGEQPSKPKNDGKNDLHSKAEAILRGE